VEEELYVRTHPNATLDERQHTCRKIDQMTTKTTSSLSTISTVS